MSSTKVITGEVRLSYANVHIPTAMEEGQDKKYNCMLLIPKTAKKTINDIRLAEKIALADLKVKLGGKIPVSAKMSVLRDGDEEHPGDETYEGMYFMGTSTKTEPGLFDENGSSIMSSDQIYSGCYALASINIYEFTKGKKGVTAGLNGLKKTKDGERLGGGVCTASDFENDDLN